MEEVAIAFAADVEEAVAGVKDLARNSQVLADTAKEAADGVASMAEPATAAADATKAVADSAGVADEALKGYQESVRANTEAVSQLTEATARLAEAQQAAAVKTGEAAAAQDEAAGKNEKAGEASAGMGKKLAIAALGIGLIGAASVKMAADWQESVTTLVTGAGESDSQVGMLKNGILQLSVQTNTSVKDLTAGLYMISSAGYHGAGGLKVLQAAAEGAKTGDADLASVANVLTSVLNAYHMPVTQATAVTSQLVATVAAGKMHMDDLTHSLASVLPVAASAHISFAQVGGALATMTMQGMTAHRATMNLANMIRSLLNPTAQASQEMKNLGLNASEVSTHLGKSGLTGTISQLTEAILRNTKGGFVLASTFNQMTPQARQLAESIAAGTITTKQLSTATSALTPLQANLVSQFAKSAESATGLKQTFDGAMAKMVGGATGLNVALLVGGQNMSAFKGNVDSIAQAAKNGATNVQGWAQVQGDFNFKLGQAKQSALAVGYALGDALLPAATQVMGVIATLGEWFAKNQWAAVALAAVLVGTLSFVLGGKLIKSVSEARAAFKELKDAELVQAMQAKLTAAAQWLLNTAMDANPVFLLIAAIVALVAIFAVLWTHCAAFRKFWEESWQLIEFAAVVAWHVIDTDAIHPIMHGIDILVHWVEAHWKLLATILATVLLGPVAGLVMFLATHWQMVISAVEHMVSVVTGWFTRLPGMILRALGDLGSVLWNAGVQLVQGFIGGIISMGSAVGNALLGLLPGPVRRFASWLGLGSPSRLFHEFGVNTLQGYINGIREMAPNVHAALSAVGGQIAGGGLPGITGGSYASGAPSVHIQVPMTLMPGTQGYNSPQFLQYLQEVVQEAVLRYNLNNPGNGLALTGRL